MRLSMLVFSEIPLETMLYILLGSVSWVLVYGMVKLTNLITSFFIVLRYLLSTRIWRYRRSIPSWREVIRHHLVVDPVLASASSQHIDKRLGQIEREFAELVRGENWIVNIGVDKQTLKYGLMVIKKRDYLRLELDQWFLQSLSTDVGVSAQGFLNFIANPGLSETSSKQDVFECIKFTLVKGNDKSRAIALGQLREYITELDQVGQVEQIISVWPLEMNRKASGVLVGLKTQLSRR